VLARSGKSVWELLDSNQHLVAEFIEALNNLYRKGLIQTDGEKLYLTEEGRRKVSDEVINLESGICRECGGRTIKFDGKFREVLKEFRRIADGRPKPTLKYFQGYMREYDVVARVALMHHYGDLAGNDFILIGDDDLLSVALSLTGVVGRVLVLDIDERIGDFLGEVNREYGFSIEFRRYNVADPLPEDLIGAFDVFSSEPLETVTGLRAFVARGVSCLRKHGVGYFGLTTAEASRRKWISIERLLTRMNCVITDIIRGFSRYPMRYETIDYETFVDRFDFPVKVNPGIDWYKSALFRFEVLGEPRLVIDPAKRLRITFFDPVEDATYPAESLM